MELPHYRHDCDVCSYLGSYVLAAIHYDLYYCDKCDGGTVIARVGNEGYRYNSMSIGILLYAGLPHDNPLVEALRRQIKIWQERI